MCTSKHRLIRNTSVLPVSVRQQCRDCRWFLQHCENIMKGKTIPRKMFLKSLLIGLLERFCHSDVLWSPFIHLLHAHPQPLTGNKVWVNNRKPQKTNGNEWQEGYGRLFQGCQLFLPHTVWQYLERGPSLPASVVFWATCPCNGDNSESSHRPSPPAWK